MVVVVVVVIVVVVVVDDFLDMVVQIFWVVGDDLVLCGWWCHVCVLCSGVLCCFCYL